MVDFLILLYALSGMLLLYICYKSIRRSIFGILITWDLCWPLIGCSIVPIVFHLGLYEPGTEGTSYLALNSPPDLATASHILLFSLGSAVGYSYFSYNGVINRACRSSMQPFLLLDTVRVWRFLLFFGCFSYGIFFLLVDWRLAFSQASAMRSNDFGRVGEASSLMFMKTLAATGLIASCFVPGIIGKKESKIIWTIFLAFIIITYALTISRTIVMTCLIIPAVMAASVTNSRIIRLSLITALIFLMVIILLFGKGYGYIQSVYIEQARFQSITAYQSSNPIISLLNNMDFQWFSVDAGIKHYHFYGSFLCLDWVSAVLTGYIPSRWINAAGLSSVSYIYFPDSLSLPAINTRQFGFTSATIPPLSIGYSAYLLPIVGGFAVGWLKMSFIRTLEEFWIEQQTSARGTTWIPYFFFTIITTYFTFIPSISAANTFKVIFVCGLLFLPFLRIPKGDSSLALSQR